MREPNTKVLHRLEEKGLIRWEGGQLRTTRRWQAAMMRASVALFEGNAPHDDIRLAITYALLDFFGLDEAVETMADLVEAMLPIQDADLGYSPEAGAP